MNIIKSAFIHREMDLCDKAKLSINAGRTLMGREDVSANHQRFLLTVRVLDDFSVKV